MTYNVFSGTLNPTQSSYRVVYVALLCVLQYLKLKAGTFAMV